MGKNAEIPMNLDLSEQNKDEIPPSPPPKRERAVGVAAHGQAGSFLMRLQRYAVLGWFLFFLVFVILVGSYFLNTFLPKPLLVVDSEGRVIGDIDFLEPVKRLDEEIISGGMRFLDFYLSMNSHTIFDEYAVATSMMGPELLEEIKRLITEDGYLHKIATANTRSDIEFDQEENPPEIIKRGEHESAVRYRGTLTMFHKNEEPVKDPFDITLFMKFHPSTSLRRSGIEITAIHDN
ncbi:MAG: hypothetical protein ACE5F7_04970 [Nitrospiria bacterium]